MGITKSELKKGKHRYGIITTDGDTLRLSADTVEQAREKALLLGKEVDSVAEIASWSPVGYKG